MYSTLAQFKEYIWIDSTDTTYDTLLNNMLNSAEEKLNNLCWVDSFAKWTRTQTIEKRWIYYTPRWLEFYLKNKPVISIDKMNWENYSWEKGTDYLVMYDRRCIFKSLTLNDRWMLELEYTAWYETIPYDIQLLELMLASWIRQAHNNEWVQSYKLWDETITFWSKTWQYGNMTPDDIYFSFTTLLNKYKNFNLPI